MECLITKLKGTVNDDTLPKFGVFTFKVRQDTERVANPTSDNLRFKIKTVNESTLKVVGNGFIGTDSTTIESTELTIPADTLTEIYCSEPDATGYNLEITANDIKELRTFNEGSYSSNTNVTQILVTPVFNVYVPNLKVLKYNGTKIIGSVDYLRNSQLEGDVYAYLTIVKASARVQSLTGDIESFANQTNITKLFVNGMITGDIASLGKLINLVYLGVFQTAMTGDLVKFAEAQIANGRDTTAGYGIYMVRPFTRVKFGTYGSNSNSFNYLRWDSNKIWLYNSPECYFKRLPTATQTSDEIRASLVTSSVTSDNIFEVTDSEE